MRHLQRRRTNVHAVEKCDHVEQEEEGSSRRAMRCRAR